MFAFLRTVGRAVDYTVPPQEITPPSDAQRLAELRSRQDAALRLIDDLMRAAGAGDVSGALLEVRLALWPSAPVISGRTT